MSQPLYIHRRQDHQPVNINEVHAAERLGLNARIAVWISAHVGSMICAYIFAGIGVGSLVGVLTNNTLLALLCGSFSSYFLQLVLLPILALGQNILGRHAELQAEEQYRTTQQIFADSEQLIQHLTAQDTLAQQQEERLQQIATSLERQQELLFFLLDHFGVEARFDTAGHLPIVRLDQHRVSIDKDKLIAGLILAGHKAETVGGLELPELLALDRARPRHHEEADHAPERTTRPVEPGLGAAHGVALRPADAD